MFKIKIPKTYIHWEKIAKVFLLSFSVILFIGVFSATFYLGYLGGYSRGVSDISQYLVSLVPSETTNNPTITPSEIPIKATTPIVKITPKVVSQKTTWGGPDLWIEVNNKRREYGVNPLSQRDELCTIASIRLNELLALGKLDGHEGFSNLSERRPDLKWIFEKYSVVAEFLAMGGESAQETVSLWNNTLGHKKLLDGGEYVWGCIYAQNTFAVAIAAY